MKRENPHTKIVIFIFALLISVNATSEAQDGVKEPGGFSRSNDKMPDSKKPVLEANLMTGRFAVETTAFMVDSPAFVFSPGNWVGDDGRAGKVFRQTWNPGAYFRVEWETRQSNPAATILLDTSFYPPKSKPPEIAYCIDGVWKLETARTNQIAIEGITGAGKHELSVYLAKSEQSERWGSDGKSGMNVLRVTGLQVDAGSEPISHPPTSKWALIVGDSITEGIGATELASYAHLVGQSLRSMGYEYGISACGWSGWINRGDNPPGDVPGYYVITNSINGAGGQYVDAASRWNKIDGNRHSLLDARGHLSAYGPENEEPSLILINYGTNDALHHSNPSDVQASIVQCLSALGRSAPDAQIVVLIPFGQYCAEALRQGIETYKQNHPRNARIATIDLGSSVARTLAAKNGLMGGLHPNDRGCADLAAQIIPQLTMILTSR